MPCVAAHVQQELIYGQGWTWSQLTYKICLNNSS